MCLPDASSHKMVVQERHRHRKSQQRRAAYLLVVLWNLFIGLISILSPMLEELYLPLARERRLPRTEFAQYL